MIVSFSFPYGFVGILSFTILANCLQENLDRVLNEYILHFEPVFFDQHLLKDQHRRSVRSPMDRYFTLRFTAYNRVFRLRLKRDTWVFAEDTKFESSTSTVQYDKARVLAGFVEGEENSTVHGVLLDSGLLDGSIRIGATEYFVEPAKNYFSPLQHFHSVVYKLSDIHFPETNRTCMPSVEKSSDCKHSKYYYLSKRSVRDRKHTKKPNSHKIVNKLHKTNIHKRTRIHKYSHKKKRHDGKRQKHHPNMKKSKKQTHRDSNEIFDYLQDQSHQSTSKTFVDSRLKSKHWFIDSRSRLSPDYDLSANTKSSLDDIFGNTETFTPSSEWTYPDTPVTTIEESTLKGKVTMRLNPETSLKDKHDMPETFLENKYDVFEMSLENKYGAPETSQKAKNNIPLEDNHDGRGMPLEDKHDESKTFLDYKHQVSETSQKDKYDAHEISLEDKHDEPEMPLKNKYDEPKMFLEDKHETPKTFLIDIHDAPEVSSEGKNDGPETSLEDKRDVPYWRELDALHYTEDGRTGSSEPYGVRSIQRTQWNEDRGQRHVAVDRRKSTCLLYLQADHLFYQRMGSEEACIDAMTRHVQRVNSIYRTTDFDQDGRPDNISFLIKRIKVHTKPDEPDYRFVGSNYGVEKFLELFSEDDYDAFCLAYMFTYRDFEGGTLGLAWTGDLKNAGGVCEKNGHYRGSLKSLNTGIITLLNYGKHVPPVVSHVTLAHEIGHNFGSPHDPEDDLHCTPGGDHGNYIMFARATSGDKKNNNKFSPCSLRSINAVLNTKARSVKGCFTEPLDAVCGNEVVEGAEECDCGWEEDCHEPCCFPMRVNPPQDQPPCRLRPAAFCSPSQGPCCSHDCRLKYGVQCREDNGCRTASFCDGQGPLCPPSTKKPNKTVCSEEFVCYNGECTGSICMAYGLESCQCIRNYHDPLIRSCELCCKLPRDELSCKSSFEWNVPPYDVPDLYAKPGAPCDNYNGYCDVHQSCREIDPSGPLATLRNLLMSPEGVAILKKWIAEKWWSMLLLFFGSAIIVFLSVRLLTRRSAKNFLSTILPGQTDFRICNIRSSSRSHPSCMVTSPSVNSGHHIPMTKNGVRPPVSRPRISAAPENGWV